MKQICIIMAVYNGERYLSEQIDSLLKNTYQNFTLHIFDDKSTDQSAKIIADYEQRYPKQIIGHRNAKNHGVIRNFLEGTRIMDADYYMFCDQDDVWYPDKIQHTLHHMEAVETQTPSQPVVVFGDATVVDEHLKEIAPSFQKQSGYQTDHIDLPHLLMENKLIGCTIMFNRSLRNLLSEYPNEIRMHDWWIALLGAAFGTVSYLEEPLLLYRQHGRNIVGNISKGGYLKDRITHLKKQRQALYQTCAQADAFLHIYSKQLEPKSRQLLQIFASLPEKNWLCRRYYVLRYHFLKSGFVRNIGVLLVI